MTANMDQSFPKSVRLRKSAQYRWIQAKGTKLYGRLFMLQYALSSGSLRPPRLGLTVSTKYGPSVARNCFKRRLREIFRKSKDRLVDGVTIHIRPLGKGSPQAREKLSSYREVPSYQNLEREWWQLLERARLLK